VKIDVGLERLGVPAEQATETILSMLELPHLRLAGVCAHPHGEGADHSYVDWQLSRFTRVVDELEARGVTVPIRLFAATPFVLRYPHTFLNAVDPGRMLYGITFPDEVPPVDLQLAFRAFTARIVAVKEIAPRDRFADKSPFPVPGSMRLGVVPVGAADGLRMLHAGRMLVRGRRVPILSSPNLEHTRIDLTSVPAAQVGDEAVIIGRQDSEEITTAEVAERNKLGLHHIATTIGPRVTRIYVGG